MKKQAIMGHHQQSVPIIPLPCQVIELLLDRGAHIDAPNRQGWTALHRAACNGCEAACRLLLRRGASIHALTTDYSIPLHLAAKYNQLGVMHLLLDLGSR